MIRYSGQPLRSRSRIAVLANDAIGNFVVATPLLRMLRDRWEPASLDYCGGERTWELQKASELVDWTYPLWGSSPDAAASAIAGRVEERAYDLVVNVEATPQAKLWAALLSGPETLVCGPCWGDDNRRDLAFAPDDRGRLWQDPEWICEDLPQAYPFLSSGFIGELFCRLCYLEGPVPRYEVPAEPPPKSAPDVLIATSASLPEKLWPLDKWVGLLSELREAGRTVGLLGAKPMTQSAFWIGSSAEEKLVADGLAQDLRGMLTLPQVVGALAQTRAVVTLDNGILHLAAATTTPTVGLFRFGIHRLWAPPAPNVTVLTAGSSGQVADIEVAAVLGALKP